MAEETGIREPAPDTQGELASQAAELMRQRFPASVVEPGISRPAAITVRADELLEVLTTLNRDPDEPADFLSDLTGVDETRLDHTSGCMRVVYQLCNASSGRRIQVETETDADRSSPSAVNIWPAAAWPEREVSEMLGVEFGDHPSPGRLLTTAENGAYPLQKAFPVNGRVGRAHGEALSRADLPASHSTGSEPEPGIVQLELDSAEVVRDAALRLQVQLDGDDITAVRFEPGFVHSGIEKLSESRTYLQNIPVVERANDRSPYATSLAFALATESLLGIEAPPRAQYARVVLAELARISDHLSNLAAQSSEAGANSAYHLLMRQQDVVRELFAVVEGRRWSSGLTRIGGLARDLPEEFEPRLVSALKETRDALTQVERHLMRNRIWRRRLEGTGALSGAEAVSWGVSGPALRATGVERDIRRADPYLVYEELDFDIPVGSAGDVVDRSHVRLAEIDQSCTIIEQAIAKLPAGEFRVEDHKVSVPSKERLQDMETLIHHFELLMDGHGLRPPAGAEVYAPTESANGELGFFLVSDGTDRPYRCRLRPPSLFHAQILDKLILGTTITIAPSVVASMNIVPAEMDR